MRGDGKKTRAVFNTDKGITDETLTAFGVTIRDNGTVILPYEGRLRERIDLPRPREDGRRFVWGESDVAISPYNATDASKRTVFITEGETDCMRLWQDLPDHAKAGVVGLPGVESWKDEWVARFEGAKQIYVCLDNPTGYDDPAQLERAWRKMRGALGQRARRVYLRDDCKDVVEFLQKYGYAAFAHLVKNEASGGRQHWQSLDLMHPPEPPDWLLRDILARGQTNVLIGQAWGGKSFWYLGLVVALMRGERTYCGIPLRPASDKPRILVVDEENPSGIPIWRLRKLGLTDAQITSGQLRYLSKQGIKLDRDVDKLMDEAAAHEPELMIFDSFDRMHRMENPNASSDVSAVFTECLMPLTTESGAATLILHHENKPPPPPKSGPPLFRNFAQRSRGSGALAESADQGLILEVDTEDKALKTIRMGGSRSSHRFEGDVLCEFRIVDVDKGIQIKESGPKWESGDDDDEL